MTLSSAFNFGRPDAKRPARTQLQVETLEDRSLLDAHAISGHVFQDLNNNGIRDGNEPLLANTPIELRNGNGVVVGKTTTDGNGFYVFNTDATIDTTPKTVSYNGAFPDTRTNSTQTLDLPKFDPSLGKLLSVEVRINGHVASRIKVENDDPSPGVISATTAGTLTVTGPGFAVLVSTNTNTKSFNAGAFDGTIDFGGTSGKDFGIVTVSGSNTQTITKASDLASYVGTGKVTVAALAQASSSANAGGNFDASISSTGGGDVTIVYTYAPDNSLQPGDYVILESKQPGGYLDGLESRNGTVLANSVGTDSIGVTLANQDLVNNDFGELLPSALGGNVYFDKNNDGHKDAGEDGIGGVTITLTGANDVGQQVNVTQKTAANGSYNFAGLRPGTYTLIEVQPAGYLDGKDAIGSLNATLGNDGMAGIRLGQGTAGTDFNFGEIKPSSLGGSVYHDQNKNGRRDNNEPGIANVVITLTGTDDLGNSITITTKTNAKGAYKFLNLRPGTYNIAETQPANFKDGKESAGSLGGNVGDDNIANIVVGVAKDGAQYNFGELRDSGGGSQGEPLPTSKIFYLASVILQRAKG